MSVRDHSGSADLSLWVRVEWRSRWRSYLVLAGVLGVTVGVLVATLTAASQSESAFTRLRAATRATDLSVYFGENILTDPETALQGIEGVDGVSAVAIEVQPFVLLPGGNFGSVFQAYVRVDTPGGINSPVIVSGRAIDPQNLDEVVLSERLAADLGFGVGDTVPLESATAVAIEADNNDLEGGGDGPKVTATVVGIGKSPIDFGRFRGVLYISPAYWTRYGKQVAARVRVEADLSAEALRLIGTEEGPALPDLGEASPYGAELSLFGDSAAATTALSTIANALRLVGAVGALAGAAAAAIVLLRIVGVAVRGRATLAAIGWTRRRHALAVAVAIVPWLTAGLVVGVGAGVWLSPLAMVSLARQIDPTADSVTLNVALVLAIVAGVIVVGSVVLAAVVRIALSDRGRRTTPRRHRLAICRPLPVSLGVRQALFGRAEQGGRASRGALVAVMLGVSGAVAALVVSASIVRLDARLELSGQRVGRVTAEDAHVVLKTDEQVGTLAVLYVSGSPQIAGVPGLSWLVYDIDRGEPLTVLNGRLAQQSDEVAFGPKTLTAMGKRVGDVVTIAAGDDSDRAAGEEYEIVGEVLFPEGDFKHDEGGALTVSGANRLLGDITDNSYATYVAFGWGEGVDVVAADAELTAAGFRVENYTGLITPAVVSNLVRVRELPRLLAVFLGMLALLSLAHALSVSVRLRVRQLATLRALGVTTRSRAVIFGVQTFCIVALAVLIGIPVGYVAGNAIWRPIAERANLVVSTAMPWNWIGVLCGVALTGGVLVAAVTGWRVTRPHTSDALRAD